MLLKKILNCYIYIHFVSETFIDRMFCYKKNRQQNLNLSEILFYNNLCYFLITSPAADVGLDVDTLTDDQIVQLNVCGTQFGMGKKDYVK